MFSLYSVFEALSRSPDRRLGRAHIKVPHVHPYSVLHPTIWVEFHQLRRNKSTHALQSQDTQGRRRDEALAYSFSFCLALVQALTCKPLCQFILLPQRLCVALLRYPLPRQPLGALRRSLPTEQRGRQVRRHVAHQVPLLTNKLPERAVLRLAKQRSCSRARHSPSKFVS